jgi:hypothetical protein
MDSFSVRLKSDSLAFNDQALFILLKYMVFNLTQDLHSF